MVTTVGDVIAFGTRIMADADIFGSDQNFPAEEAGRLYRLVGDAVLEENGLPRGTTPPRDTVRGENAMARFQEWKRFLLEHGVT